MAELASRSGVPRETIHFYLREGLLPRPRKGGQTVAWYDEEHLEKLRLIRRLREEKYLPIAVIRTLLESPEAAHERDVDVIAEVLHIVPASEATKRAPSPAALEEASARGLLGPRREATDRGEDLAERRVLGVVDDAIALDERARELTLKDLALCAQGLTELVAREGEIFFDVVLESGDIGASIEALRSGRGAVARFIAAYRDLMLRRIVEAVLVAIQEGPTAVARTANVAISEKKQAELGLFERRRTLEDALLRARARGHEDAVSGESARVGEQSGDVGEATKAGATMGDVGEVAKAGAALVWHLFTCGAVTELASTHEPSLGPTEVVLVAWGAHEAARSAQTLSALERAAAAATDEPVAQILVGEAVIARGLRHRAGGASLLEQAVPALRRLFTADPDRSGDAAARGFGWFHRGRVELALPLVFGRGARGRIAIERALSIASDPTTSLDPVARLRLGVNARLALARHDLERGEVESARRLLEEARTLDPEGPVAAIVEEELARA